jgi:hypothetical protein
VRAQVWLFGGLVCTQIPDGRDGGGGEGDKASDSLQLLLEGSAVDASGRSQDGGGVCPNSFRIYRDVGTIGGPEPVVEALPQFRLSKRLDDCG